MKSNIDIDDRAENNGFGSHFKFGPIFVEKLELVMPI